MLPTARKLVSMMTKRTFLETIIASAISEDVKAFAEKELASLDKKNASAKVKRTEISPADKEAMSKIMDYCSTHKHSLGSELGIHCGISTPKAIALGKKLVDMGQLKISTVKVEKVGERKVFSLVD